jgi:nonribosomal peptide synthetase DhbF
MASLISGPQKARESIALTWAERTIWLASAVSADPTAYNAACVITIDGEIEAGRLAAAIRTAMSELTAVRVVLGDGELEWRAAQAGLPAVDVIALEAPCLAEGACLLKGIFRNEPIRADACPLIRVHMVRVGAGRTLIMVRHHHVLLDFYAVAALVRNIAALYGGVAPSQPDNCRRAIVLAEKTYFASERFSEDRSYWRTRMEGVSAAALWSRLQKQIAGRRFELAISAPVFAAFSVKVRSLDATPFQALLLIAYAHLSGGCNEDIVFGIPFANRTAEYAQALASLSRIVPFRAKFASETPMAVALANIRRMLKEDLARGSFPIRDNDEHIFRGPLHNALPKVALNYMRASALNFGGATGAITEVLYGERNAETYIRCIEEADGGLSISLDGAAPQVESLGSAMHAAIVNWRPGEGVTVGALLGG